jgi:hypothetical protein
MHRMRRAIKTLFACLAIALVASLAVAWGLACVRLDGDVDDTWFESHEEAPYWSLERRVQPGFERLVWTAYDGRFSNAPGTNLESVLLLPERIYTAPPSWSSVDWHARPHAAEARFFWLKIEAATGWPMMAMHGAMEVDFSSHPHSVRAVGSIPIDRHYPQLEDFYGARLIPLRPIWPGLLANTVFYGVILWALWFTPGAVRRGLRRRRGACVRCGYDRRGISGGRCAECGA